MWIFTRFGFISVVEDKDKPDLLLVRGRVREDLTQISTQYFGGGPDVEFTPDHDYPYRFRATRLRFNRAAQLMVGDIDYTNFKAEVHEVGESMRDDAYGEVWRILHALEDLNPESEQRK